MDQLFDRFGNLLKSFFDESGSSRTEDTSFSDPDIQDAWDELNDFLNSDGPTESKKDDFAARVKEPAIPEVLKKDYALLNANPGAPIEKVAKSYRLLLREHHPDRHAADPAAFAKATEKTKNLTVAFRRIKTYTETGKIT